MRIGACGERGSGHQPACRGSGGEQYKKKVAIDLFPQSTELLVEFERGPANAKVKGSVMANVPVDSMKTTVEQKFSAKKGKQKPEYYYTATDEKVKDVLISKIGATEFEQAGQTVTNVQTGEEELEVNTAISPAPALGGRVPAERAAVRGANEPRALRGRWRWCVFSGDGS